MFRIIGVILLLLLLVGGFAWYSMQSLPSWYDESVDQDQYRIDALSSQIKEQGVSEFLGSKVADVLNGQVVLTQPEFNAIFIASLKADDKGQELLDVSDAIKAFLHEDKVELTAIINLDKVEASNPKAREAVEKFDRIFPFIQDSRVALTVYGTPVARNGRVGIKDDFHLKVGALPISNETLRGLGVEVERANTTDLALKYLSIQSIQLQDEQVGFSVLPRF